MKKYVSISALIVMTAFLLLPSLLLAKEDVVSFESNGLKVIFKKVTTNQVISANLYLKGGALLLEDSKPKLRASYHKNQLSTSFFWDIIKKFSNPKASTKR